MPAQTDAAGDGRAPPSRERRLQVLDSLQAAQALVAHPAALAVAARRKSG